MPDSGRLRVEAEASDALWHLLVDSGALETPEAAQRAGAVFEDYELVRLVDAHDQEIAYVEWAQGMAPMTKKQRKKHERFCATCMRIAWLEQSQKLR